MKSLDEYYNQPVKKLTEEELKEWIKVHRSQEEIEQLDPNNYTIEEKQEMLDTFRKQFKQMYKKKIDEIESLSPIKNNGFIYDEYLDLDRYIADAFLAQIHYAGLDKILDELTVEEYVEAPMGNTMIKKKILHIYD